MSDAELRYEGLRIKADILASIEAAQREVAASQAYRAAETYQAHRRGVSVDVGGFYEAVARAVEQIGALARRRPNRSDYRLAGN